MVWFITKNTLEEKVKWKLLDFSDRYGPVRQRPVAGNTNKNLQAEIRLGFSPRSPPEI